MTTAYSLETALETIAAYGADAGRWPAEGRIAIIASQAAGNADVAAALAEAQRLDALVGSWARDVPAMVFDAAAIAAAAPSQLTPAQDVEARAVPVRSIATARRWMAGAALAAAAVLGFAVLGPNQRTATMPVVASASPAATPAVRPPPVMTAQATLASPRIPQTARSAAVDGEGFGSDSDVFANVFTPTVYEDELI